MPFVLDNSVVCGWFLENQATAYTAAVGRRLQEEKAYAPPVWELELANVLRAACMRQQMTQTAAHVVIEQVLSLPIEIDRKPVPANEILGLALRFGLCSYDAAYLELALRLKLQIATADGPLHDAALAAGVGVVAGDP